MDRRRFMHSLAASALSVGAFRAWSAPAEPAGAGRLVVVMLRGAVDGLSVVVPYSDPDYQRARPDIALPPPGQEGGVWDLDGRFGLHPALAPLMPLWQAGRLGFVHASGSPDASRSHFDAQDYLESGTPGKKNTADGWLNRLLGALPPGPTAAEAANAVRAVNLGPTLPRILSGSRNVASLAQGAKAGRPQALDRPRIANAFDQLYAADDALGRTYRNSQAARQEVAAALAQADDAEMEAANRGAPLPNGFAEDAARLGDLLRKDAQVRIAFTALGGWDTHANQGKAQGQLANRLAPLGQGLKALADHLGPVFERTTIVVMSEFGRTVRQNGNGGTDHGHGNVMWLLGGGVDGGRVHGDWPGLSDSALFEGRDLAVTTDFRLVLAQVLQRGMGLPDARLAQVFPNLPGPSGRLRVMKG